MVLGSLPLSSRVLSHLWADPRISIAGVVCERKSREFPADPFHDPCVFDTARQLGAPLTTLEEIVANHGEGALDFAVSARAPWILRPEFLARFRKGVVNMHGGPLPEMRGVHNANHAILAGFQFSGATLHYMDDGIDTGPILGKRTFPIGPHDTAHDVFMQTQVALWQLYLEVIESVIEDQDAPVQQDQLIAEGATTVYFNRNAINQRRRLDPNMDPTELYRSVRGLDFPGHEPAHFLVEGRKVYLTTRPFFLQER